MSGTATDNDLRADVDVNVGFLFFSFSLKSTETTSIRGGKVMRYRKTIDTGGDHREITGELDGGMFTILIRDGEKVERKVFSTMIYEVTNMEYPEVTLAPGEVRRMRVLDLENSEVVDRVYRYVAEEQARSTGVLSALLLLISPIKIPNAGDGPLLSMGYRLLSGRKARKKQGFSTRPIRCGRPRLQSVISIHPETPDEN